MLKLVENHMLRHKSRRDFLIFMNKALFLKILTKKCQKSDFFGAKIGKIE